MPDPEPPKPAGHLTLLEALLFLGILGGVVGFVVLPAIRDKRIQRNEQAALNALVAISQAESVYMNWDERHVEFDLGRKDWVWQKKDIRKAGKPPPSSFMTAGRKNGYSFSLVASPDPESGTCVRANPLAPGKTGRRFFLLNGSPSIYMPSPFKKSTGYFFTMPDIRFRLGAPASSADPPAIRLDELPIE